MDKIEEDEVHAFIWMSTEYTVCCCPCSIDMMVACICELNMNMS